MINNELYAIKIIPISTFPNRGFPNNNFDEFDILTKLQKYDFILKIIISFHDYENLYLVSKLYENNLKLEKEKIWNESQIQFFSACIIQSLSHLRKEQIIHRDLHFGNLLFDKDFYINIIDFHRAIEYKNKDNFDEDFIVAPHLCSPEITYHLNIDYNSDYYSLGGMIYYIIFKSYFNYINNTNKSLAINPMDMKNYSYNLIDFVNQLLIINSTQRLGYKNIDELKNHEFFSNFNWDKLQKRTLISPFLELNQNNDVSFINKKMINKIIHFFKNYTFVEKINKYDSSNIELENQLLQIWNNTISKYK